MAQAIKRGDAEVLLSALPFEVKEVEGEDRVLQFVGSDETPDRDNDIIEVNGWELANYRKNPVFLWAHDYRFPPIGRAKKVAKSGGRLAFDIEFPARGVFPFADLVFDLYKDKFLRATSVGFIPKKSEIRDDEEVEDLPEWRRGRRYKKQELLELSAVPVPANPNALQLAQEKGFVSDDEAEALAKSLDGELGCATKVCRAIQGLWQAETAVDAQPVEVVPVTTEAEEWKCPYCEQLIGEKELYHDGKDWFHSPCRDKGPILLPGDVSGGESKRTFLLVIDRTEQRIAVLDHRSGVELGDVAISNELKDWAFRPLDDPGQKVAVIPEARERLIRVRELVEAALAATEDKKTDDSESEPPEDQTTETAATQADEIDLDSIQVPTQAAGDRELNIEPEMLKAMLKEVVREELDKARGKVS